MPEQTQRELIINYVPGEECRVAVLSDGQLDEFHSERFDAVSHVGNIYVGRVTNVEPAIQAAFVDFGLPANGFLHVSDLHPRYFPGEGQDTKERVGKKTPRRERPPIQEALKRGQEVIVQVLKEGVGSKGPTLTSYLSIPGRYLVMMPQMDRVGVSRKVEDEELRAKMKAILDALELPEGFGFIVRTAGLDRTKTELKRDLAYLQRLWKDMERRRKASNKPRLLYSESDLLLRALRDMLTSDTGRVVIDHQQALRRAARFMRIVSPRTMTKLVNYTGKAPVFHALGVQEQIANIYAREVPLPSGGRLVIDETEALVAIDVNSGKSRSAGDSEQNAYRTNMEAAEVICRQLRLRDLGGIVVNDLIDMRLAKHRRDVERRFEELLKTDRARSTVLPISEFGVLQLTRQRMRGSHEQMHFGTCPTCRGRGLVQKAESVAADALRELAAILDRERVARAEMVVHPRIAAELIATKRRALARVERDSGKKISVRLSDAVPMDRVGYYAYDADGADLEIERLPALAPPAQTLVKYEEPGVTDTPALDEADADDWADAPETAPDDAEPLDDDDAAQPAPHPLEMDPAALPAGEPDRDDAGGPGGGKKRRRRRGRRGRGGGPGPGDDLADGPAPLDGPGQGPGQGSGHGPARGGRTGRGDPRRLVAGQLQRPRTAGDEGLSPFSGTPDSGLPGDPAQGLYSPYLTGEFPSEESGAFEPAHAQGPNGPDGPGADHAEASPFHNDDDEWGAPPIRPGPSLDDDDAPASGPGGPPGPARRDGGPAYGPRGGAGPGQGPGSGPNEYDGYGEGGPNDDGPGGRRRRRRRRGRGGRGGGGPGGPGPGLGGPGPGASMAGERAGYGPGPGPGSGPGPGFGPGSGSRPGGPPPRGGMSGGRGSGGGGGGGSRGRRGDDAQRSSLADAFRADASRPAPARDDDEWGAPPVRGGPPPLDSPDIEPASSAGPDAGERPGSAGPVPFAAGTFEGAAFPPASARRQAPGSSPDGPGAPDGLNGPDAPVDRDGPDGPDGPGGPDGPDGPDGPGGPGGPDGPDGPPRRRRRRRGRGGRGGGGVGGEGGGGADDGGGPGDGPGSAPPRGAGFAPAPASTGGGPRSPVQGPGPRGDRPRDDRPRDGRGRDDRGRPPRGDARPGYGPGPSGGARSGPAPSAPMGSPPGGPGGSGPGQPRGPAAGPASAGGPAGPAGGNAGGGAGAGGPPKPRLLYVTNRRLKPTEQRGLKREE